MQCCHLLLCKYWVMAKYWTLVLDSHSNKIKIITEQIIALNGLYIRNINNIVGSSQLALIHHIY